MKSSRSRVSRASNSIAAPTAESSVHVSTTATDVSFERIRIEAAVAGENAKSSFGFDEVFVIPGNPGVPGFYERYARTLWAELDGTASVEVVGYVGHTEFDLGTKHTKWFTLGEQVEHVTAEITKKGDKKNKKDSQISVAVVGHSIGAEIALRAMRRNPHLIHKVVGLMPFILTNKKSVLQKFLSFLVMVKPLVFFVASVVGFLKTTFPKFLSNLFTKGMDSSAKGNTERWLRFGSVVNMALMGNTEFLELADPRKDDDWRVLEKHGERVSFLYAEHDHWAPTWQAEAFCETYGKLSIEVARSEKVKVEHAFVLSDLAADLVAVKTAGLLGE